MAWQGALDLVFHPSGRLASSPTRGSPLSKCTGVTCTPTLSSARNALCHAAFATFLASRSSHRVRPSPGIDQRSVEGNHMVAVLTPAPQDACSPQGRFPHVLTKIPADPKRIDGPLECGDVPDGHEQSLPSVR